MYTGYSNAVLAVNPNTSIVVTSTSYTINNEPPYVTLPSQVNFMYLDLYQSRYLAGYLSGLVLQSIPNSGKVCISCLC